MKSASASRRWRATSFVCIFLYSGGAARLPGRRVLGRDGAEAAHRLLHRRIPARGVEPAVVGAGDGAGVAGVVPDRLALEVIERRRRLVADGVALGADLQTEIAVLVVADDEVLGEAVHRLVERAVHEERGAGDARDLARAVRRREVARIALEVVAVVPSALGVAVEIEAGVLERAVVEDELGADRADALAFERGQHRAEPTRGSRQDVAVEEEERLAGRELRTGVVRRGVAEIH